MPATSGHGGETGEPTRQEHGEDDDPADADPGVVGGVRVGADGDRLEAERRAPQHERHDDAQQRASRSARRAGAGSELDQLRQPRRRRDGLRPGHAGRRSRRMTGSVELISHRVMNRAMLFSMIVVMTSWAPVRARSTPGIPPHRAPPRKPARRMIGTARIAGVSYMNDHVPTHAAVTPPIEHLALGADVEQPGPERERQGQRRADERHRPGDRSGDPLGRAEHAPQQRPVGLERVDADERRSARRRRRTPAAGRQRDEDRLDVPPPVDPGPDGRASCRSLIRRAPRTRGTAPVAIR